MTPFEQEMAPLYRYLDGLTDEQRDRVMVAPIETWRPEAYLWQDGARCLVGHVAGTRPEHVVGWTDDEEPFARSYGFEHYGFVWECDPIIIGDLHVHSIFDGVCHDFTTERVVTALKAHLAKSNPKLPVASPEHEEVAWS